MPTNVDISAAKFVAEPATYKRARIYNVALLRPVVNRVKVTSLSYASAGDGMVRLYSRASEGQPLREQRKFVWWTQGASGNSSICS